MNTMNKAMAALGYVTAAFITLTLLILLCSFTQGGIRASDLINDCRDKHNSHCELIAIPKEEE